MTCERCGREIPGHEMRRHMDQHRERDAIGYRNFVLTAGDRRFLQALRIQWPEGNDE